MANYLTNNEKFHIFSKSPVLSSMAVSQAVNKSGHTVSTNDVWADDVPWFTEVADEAGAITRAADARYNDLILWGSDIYVRKGDKTNGASTGTTFAELWEKHTDLTEARAYALGSVTTQTPTNIVTKTVEIKNASDKVVLKYHVGKEIDLLTTTNNANVASTWAARMFIDGKVVDQFVSPTDKVFAGNPSTGYTTLVYTATADGNKYGFVAEGEGDTDFVNNAFAGIVQFNQSRNSGHKFAASVFEYVGDKLDATVAKLSAAVFGSGTPGGEDQPVDLVTQVSQNTAAINVLNGADTVDGSIAKSIKTAIENLGDVAVKSDITITEIKVKSGSTTTTLTPDSNKSVTVEIPEVQAATTDVAGVVTISDNDAIATTETSSSAATVAAVAATRGAIAEQMGALATSISTLEGTVSGVKTTAESAVQSVKVNGTEAKSGTEVNITAIVGVDETATNGINVTKTADNKVKVSVTPATYTNKSWDSTYYFTTASDVATAISDAVGAIEIPQVTWNSDALNAGFTVDTGDTHYLGLSTAAYTPSTVTGEIGTWTDATKGYLVTGATVAAAIGDVNAKVDALHKTPQFKVVVVDGVTDLTKWQDSVTGGIQENYIYLVENIDAADGSYIEYIAYKNGETLVTERIGTTKTDLSGYAKSVTINGTTYTASAANAGILDLGSVVNTIGVGNDTSKGATPDNAGSIQSFITGTGALYLGIASATDSVMGVSKMFTGNLSTTASTVTDTAVSVKSAQAMYSSLASGKVSSVTAGEGDALTGLSVSVGGTATAPTISVTNGVINSGSLPATAKVVANGLIDGTDVIETEKINFGIIEGQNEQEIRGFIKDSSQLTTWIGDMPNLQHGYYMFAGCSQLETFIGDLSSLTDGNCMFGNCTKLTSFTSDLSSLTDGFDMFNNCKLDAESLECIADTLPTVTDYPSISIGYNCSAADSKTAYDTIRIKGWNCTMTYKA